MGNLEAYADAGYVGDKFNACHLAAKPHVKARVAEIMERAAVRAEITGARILNELALLGFHNPSDYLQIDDDGHAAVDLSTLTRDQAAAITEVVSEDIIIDGRKMGVKTKIKLADKKAALETLGKHFGLWVERTEHGRPGDFTNVKDMDELHRKLEEELGIEDASKFMNLLRPEQLN